VIHYIGKNVKKNNIYEDSTIENDITRSRFDPSKCFNGYEIYPTSIKPKKNMKI